MLAAAACSSPAPDEGDYTTRLTKARAVRDVEFAKSDKPVPENRKAELLPLLYYPIDETFKVAAVLQPTDDKSIYTIQTSTGQPRQERRVGTLQFTLRGQPMTLLAFVEADAPNMNRLFVPFLDSTSGKETYGSGRYMDLDRTATGIYDLDFNLAYNPYCYFNLTYECPLPPAENRLKVPIEAGERVKKTDGPS